MSSAISTSKPTSLSGLRGIRLDERRAAFGIAGPAEFAGRFRRLGAEGRQNQCRQCRQAEDSDQALKRSPDNIRT